MKKPIASLHINNGHCKAWGISGLALPVRLGDLGLYMLLGGKGSGVIPFAGSLVIFNKVEHLYTLPSGNKLKNSAVSQKYNMSRIYNLKSSSNYILKSKKKQMQLSLILSFIKPNQECHYFNM